MIAFAFQYLELRYKSSLAKLTGTLILFITQVSHCHIVSGDCDVALTQVFQPEQLSLESWVKDLHQRSIISVSQGPVLVTNTRRGANFQPMTV